MAQEQQSEQVSKFQDEKTMFQQRIAKLEILCAEKDVQLQSQIIKIAQLSAESEHKKEGKKTGKMAEDNKQQSSKSLAMMDELQLSVQTLTLENGRLVTQMEERDMQAGRLSSQLQSRNEEASSKAAAAETLGNQVIELKKQLEAVNKKVLTPQFKEQKEGQTQTIELDCEQSEVTIQLEQIHSDELAELDLGVPKDSDFSVRQQAALTILEEIKRDQDQLTPQKTQLAQSQKMQKIFITPHPQHFTNDCLASQETHQHHPFFKLALEPIEISPHQTEQNEDAPQTIILRSASEPDTYRQKALNNIEQSDLSTSGLNQIQDLTIIENKENESLEMSKHVLESDQQAQEDPDCRNSETGSKDYGHENVQLNQVESLQSLRTIEGNKEHNSSRRYIITDMNEEIEIRSQLSSKRKLSNETVTKQAEQLSILTNSGCGQSDLNEQETKIKIQVSKSQNKVELSQSQESSKNIPIEQPKDVQRKSTIVEIQMDQNELHFSEGEKIEPAVNDSATFSQANLRNFTNPLNQSGNNQKDFSDLSVHHPASTDGFLQRDQDNFPIPQNSNKSDKQVDESKQQIKNAEPAESPHENRISIPQTDDFKQKEEETKKEDQKPIKKEQTSLINEIDDPKKIKDIEFIDTKSGPKKDNFKKVVSFSGEVQTKTIIKLPAKRDNLTQSRDKLILQVLKQKPQQLQAQFLRIKASLTDVQTLEDNLNFSCDRLLVHCAKFNVPIDKIASNLIKAQDGSDLKTISYHKVEKMLVQRLCLQEEETREVFMDYFEFLLSQLPSDTGTQNLIISQFEQRPITVQCADEIFMKIAGVIQIPTQAQKDQEQIGKDLLQRLGRNKLEAAQKIFASRQDVSVPFTQFKAAFDSDQVPQEILLAVFVNLTVKYQFETNSAKVGNFLYQVLHD